VGSKPLMNLVYDSALRRAFIANGGGELFVYSISETTATLIQQLQLGTRGVVRGMVGDLNLKYIFTCNEIYLRLR
jgi:hypothetical protein